MTNFDNVHVLIVEDNSSSVDVLAGLLDLVKIHYTVIYDSRKISDLLPQLEQLHAIFVDLEIPGLDGYEVLKILKADERLRHVPVVAYTAHLSQMAQARDAGFHGFLGKPLRASLFPAQIARILEGQPVWSVR
jgi:two-component system, cell cycle response regulator DivK